MVKNIFGKAGTEGTEQFYKRPDALKDPGALGVAFAAGNSGTLPVMAQKADLGFIQTLSK